MIEIKVNGRTRTIDVEEDTPLLWVIRDELGLTGTKFGCGVAQCGSCTVLVDGAAIRTCTTPVGDVKGAAITTIEGLAPDGTLTAVQQAWLDEQVPQCGYCQSGMLMAATALLEETPNPSDDDINDSITNICRCGTYPRIRKAIHRAAKAQTGKTPAGSDAPKKSGRPEKGRAG